MAPNGLSKQSSVIPAKVGIHLAACAGGEMDSRLRGNGPVGAAGLVVNGVPA